MNTNKFRYSYSSMTTPNSVIEYDMITKDTLILKETEVLGGKFDRKNYHTKRVWAPDKDGKKVPISLVYKKDLIVGSIKSFCGIKSKSLVFFAYLFHGQTAKQSSHP